MIDLSSVKTPGWARIVSELSAPAPDDRTFLHTLTAVLAQVSGARQAVLFAVDPAEAGPTDPRPMFVWPPAGEKGAEIQSGPDVRAAARGAADSGQLSVYGMESSGSFYGEQDHGCIIAMPVQSMGEQAPGPRGVVTLLIEQRSRQALQTTTALVEVLAGYINLHATRQQLRRTRAATAALDLAAKLIAAINNAQTFKGATFQLVNDLARQMRADRVALGWLKGIGDSGAIRVVAVSDTEMIDRRMAMIQKLESAMDECLDQEQAVLYPPPKAEGGSEADTLLAQAITHAHRELAASDARLKVVSLPLRDGDRVVGVATIESAAEGPADIASIELVQAALDLVAPVLLVRRSDDRNLAVRAAVSTVKAGRWAVGPKHTAWKLAGVALFILMVFAFAIRIEYRVEATMQLQPRVRQNIAVPYDGLIGSVPEGIKPGREVRAGDVLAMMDTTEAEFRRLTARAELDQASKESDAYLTEGKLAEAAQASHRAEQASAKLQQAENEIARARIVSPVDGTIIAGDLSDRIGAAVKLTDVLFQIASLKDMEIIAQVSDRDIGLIRDGEDATIGQFATRSNPSGAYDFKVDTVVPLAQPRDGKNVFEVRGSLAIRDEEQARRLAAGVRPGMEGIAKFNAGRHSLAWILTRRIRDQLKLWLWW